MAESVRRIRTIALVHETLSREPGDDVAFLEIVRPLLRLAEEGLQSPDRPVRFTVQGDGGRLPSTVATPLSVVLTELLQNAVDHGFPEGSGGGDVVVVLDNDDHRAEHPRGQRRPAFDPAFELNQATGLGLSIVRTLVTTELDGTITMRPGLPEDFQAVGLGDRPGAAARWSISPSRSERAQWTRAGGLVRRRCLTRRSQLATDRAALFLAGAAPDARVLVGLEGVVETVVAAPGTRRTPAWPCRSVRVRTRWCRPGRTGRGRCRGRWRPCATCNPHWPEQDSRPGWSLGHSTVIELAGL